MNKYAISILLFCLLFLLSADRIFAKQQLFKQEVRVTVSPDTKVCGLTLIELSAARPIRSLGEARSILSKVLKAARLNEDLIYFAAANVGDALAAACHDGDKTAILFDPETINELITKGGNDWVIKSIFAHEAGHLSHSDYLRLKETDDEKREIEEKADEFAGEILYKMGATLEESKAAYNAWIGDDKIYKEYNVTNYPHPSQRLKVLEDGWNKVNPDFYLKRAKTYYDSNRYDLAIADYTQAIKLNPQNDYAYFKRGICYSLNGNNNQAIADYTQAIKLNPKSPFYYSVRANDYFFISKYEIKGSGLVSKVFVARRYQILAIADLTEAIKLAPTDGSYYKSRGEVYESISNYDQAIADYTQAIKLNSSDKLSYYNRGLVYLAHKKDFDLAITDFTKVIELAPKWFLGYFQRGDAYEQKKQYSQAITDFEKGIEKGVADNDTSLAFRVLKESAEKKITLLRSYLK